MVTNRVAVTVLFTASAAACVDGPFTPQKTAANPPSLVESIDLSGGQSLVRLDLEDAAPVLRLDPETYAEHGIEIRKARLWTADVVYGYNLARSGTNWIEAGEYTYQWDIGRWGYSPIRILFNRDAPGIAKGVRIHVAQAWFSWDSYPPNIKFTCFSGSDQVGTRLIEPPYPAATPFRNLSYQPLEIRGDRISHCDVELGPYSVLDDIEITFAKEATTLDLSCTGDLGPNRVTRGQSIHCGVTATSGGALSEIRWSFVDSAGHTIAGPADSTEWRGTMVVGGTVSVTARLDSLPIHADTVISVQARNWPSMSVVAVDSGNGHLPAYPTVPKQLADTHPPIPSASIPIDTISSGPNEGFLYLPMAVASVTTVVHISAGFNRGTPLYNRQRSGVDPITGDPFCTKREFSTIIQRGTREHEGLIAGPTPSHVSVYRRWFSSNQPQDSLEAVTGYLRDFTIDYPFEAHVEAEFDQHVSTPAYRDPHQNHPTDTPPGPVAFPVVPCRPRFF